MGIKCIRTEEPLSAKEPVFIYQNMIKITKQHNPEKNYEFMEKIGRGAFSEVYK
ncbi:unnamed protein product, partial [Sphagnum balticum]